MVINRMPDTGEMAMTREEYMRDRNSKRAEHPVRAVRQNDRQIVAEVAAIVADVYNLTPVDLVNPFTYRAGRLRAATAAAVHDLYGVGWRVIADELGYRNPRASVESAMIRHSELIGSVGAVIKARMRDAR